MSQSQKQPEMTVEDAIAYCEKTQARMDANGFVFRLEKVAAVLRAQAERVRRLTDALEEITSTAKEVKEHNTPEFMSHLHARTKRAEKAWCEYATPANKGSSE